MWPKNSEGEEESLEMKIGPVTYRTRSLPKIVKIKKLRVSINFPGDSECKQINLNL